MSIVISDSLVLSQQAQLNPNNGRLCWRNIITPGNLSATSEQALQPASNMTNPSTSFAWQAEDTDQQDIDIVITSQIDYIGIARHNLRTVAEIRIQFLVGANYVTIFDWAQVPDRQAILYLINEASPEEVRISIRNNPEPPRIAVLYAGLSTLMQRRIYVGHTPVTYGRRLTVVGGMSESGQYLGEVTRRESRFTNVNLQNLTPDWYREELDPFFAQRPRRPAFWAWRPDRYSAEVGYCWLAGDPTMSNQLANGFVQASFDLEAIA